MKYLNLGCGNRFHPEWTNVNFTSTGVGVIACNLAEGIPFPDASYDVVYHSHLLEHFPKQQAQFFLQECYRVLRSKGLIRIAVPDLEQIARSYLFALEQAVVNSNNTADNYNWMLLELLDQSTRNKSGGEMAAYLLQENIPNEDFILKRLGVEAKNLIAAGQHQRHAKPMTDPLLKRAFRPIKFFVLNSSYRRNIFLKFILGTKDYQALEVGRFRQSGEIHQWMYDRFSLKQLLEQRGFVAVTQRTAVESHLKNWVSFNLDTEPDGKVYKPDSLFMEALKP